MPRKIYNRDVQFKKRYADLMKDYDVQRFDLDDKSIIIGMIKKRNENAS